MDKKATTNEQRGDEETCSAQIFVSSPVLHEKEPGLLEKWPILGLGRKCTKRAWNALWYQKVKKVLQNEPK